jgi:hypothetical protein
LTGWSGYTVGNHGPKTLRMMKLRTILDISLGKRMSSIDSQPLSEVRLSERLPIIGAG